MITTVRRRRRTCATLAAAALLATGLTACGGGDDAPSSASTPAAGSSGATMTADDPQFRWELRFVKCLREQGIQVADPDPVKGAPDVTHNAAYRAAFRTCVAEIGDPPTVTRNKGKEREILATQLRTARCLRDKGYDVADPTPDRALMIPESVDEVVFEECFAAAETP